MKRVSRALARANEPAALLSSGALLAALALPVAASCGNSAAHVCKGQPDPSAKAQYAADNTTIDVVLTVPGATVIDDVTQPGLFGGTVTKSAPSGSTLGFSIVPNIGTPSVLVETSWRCPGDANAATSELKLTLPATHNAGDEVFAAY